MLVGLVGVVLPALPCTLLIFAAGIAWAVLVADSGTGRWVVVGVMAVLFVLDAVAKYACRAAGCQASCRARRLLSGGLGAMVGFVTLGPLIGRVLGHLPRQHLARASPAIRRGIRGRTRTGNGSQTTYR